MWVEDPKEVKAEVRRFFNERFLETNEDRPKLDGVSFKRLKERDNDILGETFDDAGGKTSNIGMWWGKSSRPDGYNFNFIKILEYLKGGFSTYDGGIPHKWEATKRNNCLIHSSRSKDGKPSRARWL